MRLEVEMSDRIEIVRQIATQFAEDFVDNPYHCYTEHGLHALLFTRLYNALPDYQRYTCWGGRQVCAIQKEYPTADPLDKPRRQHWDIALLRIPPESSASGNQPSYDYLHLAAVVEVGLNEAEEHLRDDIERLCHPQANVEQGIVVHLYRLSDPDARFSGRDWSPHSSRILSVERVEAILTDERAKNTIADRDVEVLYAVAGDSGKHEAGVWLIRQGEVTRLG
jgi:hypothetical protein